MRDARTCDDRSTSQVYAVNEENQGAADIEDQILLEFIQQEDAEDTSRFERGGISLEDPPDDGPKILRQDRDKDGSEPNL